MPQKTVLKDTQTQEIITSYSLNNEKIADLSNRYHISPVRLRIILKENGVHIRGIWETRHLIRAQKEVVMSNQYVTKGDITKVTIISSKHGTFEFLIDTEDLPKIKPFYTWFVRKSTTGRTWYIFAKKPQAKGRSRNMLLHRIIMDAPENTLVDHINHNGLDNRKFNLRICSQTENQQNRAGAASHSASGIRGVYWHNRSQKWIARAVINGQKKQIGAYDNKSDAAIAVVEYRRLHMPFSEDDKVIF